MTFPRPDFSIECIAAAKAHARDAYPNESCGLIVDGQYVPCANIAADPKTSFKISPKDILAAGNKLQAVIHSHPDVLYVDDDKIVDGQIVKGKIRQGENAYPTRDDMISQIDMDCIFGIVPVDDGAPAANLTFWGDFRMEENLLGRTFIPGASDCYTLIRAYYWQIKKIKLPEGPRDHAWWKKGGDLYRDNFGPAGFVRIGADEAKEGDIFIGKIHSDVPNHGGILLNNGLALHHLTNNLSMRTPIGRWMKYIDYWLRYEGSKQEK